MRRLYGKKTMQTRTATIQNKQGIHCRPSALIVKEFQDYPGRIQLSNANGKCDLDSVMQLLSLEMNMGSAVTIEVDGGDEAVAADRLVELLETRFDFPPV